MSLEFEVVGMDIGNLTTIATSGEKTRVFDSRVSETDDLAKLGDKDKLFMFDGKLYSIEKGDLEFNRFKYQKDNFIKLLYYGISKITDSDIVKIVIGIPAGEYSKRKDHLKEIIEKNNSREISVYDEDGNLKKRSIFIQEVVVIPESYSVKTLDIMESVSKDSELLVVDVGGGTTDIAQFDTDSNFKNGKSVYTGLVDLYKDVQEFIEDSLNARISLAEVKKYVDGDLKHHADPKAIDGYIEKFYRNLVNGIKSHFEIPRYNIILAGGGAEKIYPFFKKDYPHALILTDITANSVGFYAVGTKLWK